MKLVHKQRTGERVFQHHTADEAPSDREPLWAGLSEGAEADPRSRAAMEALQTTRNWPDLVSGYLGGKNYRLLVGYDRGRHIAMIACQDSRTWEVELLDIPDQGYVESPQSIAGRLCDEVDKASKLPTMSRLERFLRYGREGID